MGKQIVPVEIDVPEGFEVEPGEYSTICKADQSAEAADGYLHFSTLTVAIRPVKSPVEAWLEQHPWLPEGCWVYENCDQWNMCKEKPLESFTVGYYCSTPMQYVSCTALASLLGKSFTPPPRGTVCIQVTRK